MSPLCPMVMYTSVGETIEREQLVQFTIAYSRVYYSGIRAEKNNLDFLQNQNPIYKDRT